MIIVNYLCRGRLKRIFEIPFYLILKEVAKEYESLKMARKSIYYHGYI